MAKKNKWHSLPNEICSSLSKFIKTLNLLKIILKFLTNKIDIQRLFTFSSTFTLYFSDKDKDRKVFRKLCKCFELYSSAGKPLKGLHKNSLR